MVVLWISVNPVARSMIAMAAWFRDDRRPVGRSFHQPMNINAHESATCSRKTFALLGVRGPVPEVVRNQGGKPRENDKRRDTGQRQSAGREDDQERGRELYHDRGDDHQRGGRERKMLELGNRVAEVQELCDATEQERKADSGNQQPRKPSTVDALLTALPE